MVHPIKIITLSHSCGSQYQVSDLGRTRSRLVPLGITSAWAGTARLNASGGDFGWSQARGRERFAGHW